MLKLAVLYPEEKRMLSRFMQSYPPRFIKANDLIIPIDSIEEVSIPDIENGMIDIHYGGGKVARAYGFDAIEAVMSLKPGALEGRRLRWKSGVWAFHNLFAHPALQILAWLGFKKAAVALHDSTTPIPRSFRVKECKNDNTTSGIHIFGGGTFSPVRNHLSLSAPSFGETAKKLSHLFKQNGLNTTLHLTKMAGGEKLKTNDDVFRCIDQLLDDPNTKVIIMNAALCDFHGKIGDVDPSWHATRLKSRDGLTEIKITPADKVISCIKEKRPDVMVVGFKTTTDATPMEQLQLAKRQCLESGSDIVLANDVIRRHNLVVPSNASLLSDCVCSTKDRDLSLSLLVEHIKSKLSV